MPMTHYADIKRKKERFPAFSDEEGVKKRSSETTANHFVSDDSWIITEQQTESLVVEPETQNADTRYRRNTKKTIERAGSIGRERETLERFRQSLPTYRQHAIKETTSTGKTSLFGTKNKQQTSDQAKQVFETPSSTHYAANKDASLKKQYTGGRSYFVPKFVPASLIPDEPEKKIEANTLYASMQKKSETYLLFDTKDAYQEKRPDEPAVKRFKKTEQITMTRNEYKAAIKTKDKKRNILDHSLNGLIEDGQSQIKENGYFQAPDK